MIRLLGGILIGIMVVYVVLTLIGVVMIGGLKDRARRNHERRHGADRSWPRFGQ